MNARCLSGVILVLAVLTTAHTLTASPSTAEPLFEARVANARVESLSLERIELSLQIAIRASRNVTIRTIMFSEGYLDRMPVWVAPIQGKWPLRKAQELVIPNRVRLSVSTRDAMRTADLSEIVRRSAVEARATVEVLFDTPWQGRLFRGATEAALTEVSVSAPLPEGSALQQPFVRLGAGMLDLLRRQAVPLLDASRNDRPLNRDAIDRFGSAVAVVETEYAIDSGNGIVRRSARTLGVWWDAAILCTTREALEPWRFRPADAALLQIDRARLRDGDLKARIVGDSRPPIEIDLVDLGRRLPQGADRGVYALTPSGPQRIRLAVRANPTGLVCLRLSQTNGNAALLAAARPASAPAVAFTVDRTRELVRTEAVPAGEAMLTLRTPVHRESFGSPLVAGTAVVGLVASSDAAWDAAALATAAKRPLRVRGPEGPPLRATD